MYCTLEDIKKSRVQEARLIQLTDDADTGEVNEEAVNGAISDAGEMIDGFLRGRYPLPLNPVPGLIRTIALDLATYGIYGLKPEFELPKLVGDRYQTSTKLLMRIQDGKMDLYEKDEPAQVQASGGPAFIQGTSVFTEERLKNF
ncbi:MAG: hypothetical protein A2075_12195 [Geobacteraceae bacterium GWC2_58_44]|nr:MAG: hypothetical protein A2075_12195 [Geobacteraceae bacterium GWC2_58_44]HBG06323.1 DUF1320 domain-containing protein [Geobacter sp.]